MSGRCALLIEGGGVRGFYSAGLLRAMACEGINFPVVIGVSSGAILAARWCAGRTAFDWDVLEGLRGRSMVNPHALVRPSEGLLLTTSLIGEVLRGCALGASAGPADLWVPATDALTGTHVWWRASDLTDDGELALRVRASASIPFIMPACEVDGRSVADGGIPDSVPLYKVGELGCDRVVCLLTRPRGYVKGRQHLEFYLRHLLRPYPALRRAMLQRHVAYNRSVRMAEAWEDEGRAFCFRMDVQDLKRFEFDVPKFHTAFDRGYEDAMARMPELKRWLAGCAEDV